MEINPENIRREKSLKELLEFGIINIDKPSGPTSFNVSDFVRRVLGPLGIRKTSHFGTLDPKVTGVLPVALNRACKLTGFFLGEDKGYVGIMRFHKPIEKESVEKAIKEKFTGKIMQKPPVKSRVARVTREREIKIFEILEQDGNDFLFKTDVQGGTYIRKLVDDLGIYLGVGAHMLELRRFRAGIFEENESVSLYELEKAVEEFSSGKEDRLKKIIIPGEIVGKLFPIVQIKADSVERAFHGQPIYSKNLKKKSSVEVESRVCVFSDDKFIGLFKIINQGKIFARPEFVMQPINK